MNAELNLFPKKIAKLRQRQKIKVLVFRMLLLFLLVLAGAMVGLSAGSIMIARENQQIDEEIKSVKSKIDSLSEVESKQVYLLSKLDSFKKVLGTHEIHQSVTETVFSLIPNGTTLKGFEVSEEGLISLSGTVPDFTTFEELLRRIREGTENSLPILEAKVNKVGFSSGGQISFDIELMIAVQEEG